MTLFLQREPSVDGATIGVLFVDAVPQCLTLEDEIRELPGITVATWKVPGRTAIPAGTYRVEITPSARFHRLMPILRDVPGFAGIRIHPGNTTADTEGCILVGRIRTAPGIGASVVAYEALLQRLLHAPDCIVITIENPRPVPPSGAVFA